MVRAGEVISACLDWLLFFFLCPFSFSPKKKDPKERRRSNATGLLFRELFDATVDEVCACGAFSTPDAKAGDGITRKSPRHPDRAGEGRPGRSAARIGGYTAFGCMIAPFLHL